MAENFVPEMHDIGKLIPSDLECPTTDGKKSPKWHGRGALANVDWGKLGVSEPQTVTWQAIRYHHDGDYRSLGTSPAPADVKAAILRLIIADHLAATASRAVPEEAKPSFPLRTEILELWNPEEPAEEQPWSPVQALDDFKELIEFINSDPPDASVFFAEYGKYLANIPEDKIPPQVITSLGTHVELVGKFFEVLNTHVQVDDDADPKQLYYGEAAPVSDTKGAEKTWRFKLLRCKLSFPQIPVRARDLNVFYVLERLTEQLAQSPQYGKYLLFHTTDTLWLFLPTDGRVTAAQILAPYLERGFYVESEEIEFTPDTFYPDLCTWLEQYPQRRQRLLDEIAQIQAELEAKRVEWTQVKAKLDSTETPREEKEVLNKSIQVLSAEIKAVEVQIEELERVRQDAEDEHQTIEKLKMKPVEGSLYSEDITEKAIIDSTEICDLCQIRQAMEEPWVEPGGALVESLCEMCRGIREEPHWYHKLNRWETDEPDTRVAWVKLTLDYEAANRVIRRLFDGFVDQLVERFQGSFALAEDLKLNFRSIAVLADLTKAYQAFLARFAQGLRKPHDGGSPLFLDEDIEEIAGRFKDFYIMRLMASEEIAGVVRLFRDLLREYFPACVEDTPIRLAISVAPIKFPFFEHWRYLQQPRDKPINIQRVGKAQLPVNFEEWRHLETIQLHQRRLSSFLHNLARIEAVTGSQILTQAVFMEQKRRFPNLINLYTLGGMDVGTILAYYKIMRD
jgi:flagellar biosynthesis chaperone FliJ